MSLTSTFVMNVSKMMIHLKFCNFGRIKRKYILSYHDGPRCASCASSTIAFEAAFSTGGRVLDSFQTSLTPRMVEALICAQDWLHKSHGPLIMEEN